MTRAAGAIAVVDVGIGNLRSVEKALGALGLAAVRTRDPGLVRAAAHAVLPGVGAFGDFMAALGAAGLDAAVADRHRAGLPTLGVCVGMQVLLAEGTEFGRHAGLGLVPGRVVPFDVGDLPVPHSGWSRLAARADDPVLGPADGAWVYFVHSYRAADVPPAAVVATADYGGPFPAAVRVGPTWGVQFHPEKSQRAGLELLGRFARVPSPAAGPAAVGLAAAGPAAAGAQEAACG